MKWSPSLKMLIKRRNAKIKKFAGIKSFVIGSTVRIKRCCGNPNCRCAKGHKHPAVLLTHKVRGKSKAIYIPVGLIEEVSKWAREYKRLKELMKEISKLNWAIIHKYVPTKRAKKRAESQIQKYL